jgi:hypothetical protein
MRITRARSLSAIAAGALTLTALAGCGSDDKAKAADAHSASASNSPSASSSSGTDVTGVTGDSDAAGPGERLTKDNLVATMLAAMRAKKTAHMTMDLGTSIRADADVRYSAKATEMKMTMAMGESKAAVILVDGVVYMQQATGGKFVKIDKDTPGMGSIVDQMSGFSPSSSIAAMTGALEKVEYAGTDTVDGDKVSKYHVTADTSAISKSLGSTGGLGDLPKTITYDLYVDGDNLMRRIDMTLGDQQVKMTVGAWGEPVDIEAPPASQIMSQ